MDNFFSWSAVKRRKGVEQVQQLVIAHELGRVVGTLVSEAGFMGSMPNLFIFHDACSSPIQKPWVQLSDLKISHVKKCNNSIFKFST